MIGRHRPQRAAHAVEASHFGIQYEITLTDEDMRLLETENAEEVSILCIVSKRNDPEGEIIPHPGCPVLINTATKRGLQMKEGQVKIDL